MSRYTDRLKREAEESARKQVAQADIAQAMQHGVLPPQVRPVQAVAQDIGQAAQQIAQHTVGLTLVVVAKGPDLVLVAASPDGQQPANPDVQRVLVKALEMSIPQQKPSPIIGAGTPA